MYNQAIVRKLEEYVEKYPDLRFGQLLVDCDVIQFGKDGVKDPFNEESQLIWERMTKNKYFHE